jgi:cullin 3
MSKYLRDKGEKLVKDQTDGANLVASGGAVATSGGGGGQAKNPITFIQSLLSLKDHFDHFLYQAFDNDKHFKQKIQADFEYFLNINDKSPEFLSLYIDEKLKKGMKGVC